jgi:hypothetical protein
MRNPSLGLALILGLLCSIPFAHAQQATERYIPLGKSPGLSDKYTYIGPISAADRENRTLTVFGPAGSRTVRITERTRIWLDRTRLRLPNLEGHFEDFHRGGMVEVEYEDHDRKKFAAWVKVEIRDRESAPGP